MGIEVPMANLKYSKKMQVVNLIHTSYGYKLRNSEYQGITSL